MELLGGWSFEDDDLRSYLTECLAWARRTFGVAEGGKPVRMQWGSFPETRFGSDGPIVRFSAGSNYAQFRHQAAHEAFHVIWGRPVHHWTHEMAAEWCALQRDTARDPGYALAGLLQHVTASDGVTMSDVRRYDWGPQILALGEVPRTHEVAMYHRVALTGLRLVGYVGVNGLRDLVQRVAASPNDQDEAEGSWTSDQPVAVRQLLALDG